MSELPRWYFDSALLVLGGASLGGTLLGFRGAAVGMIAGSLLFAFKRAAPNRFRQTTRALLTAMKRLYSCVHAGVRLIHEAVGLLADNMLSMFITS